MGRRGKAIVVALALVAGACAGSQPQRRSDEPHGAGSPLPAIALPLLQGGTWRSSDALGSVLVVDIWATWCKPCRKGFPLLDEIARKHRDARFVAISLDEAEATVRAFLDDVPTELPIALDSAQWSTKAPLEIARVPTVLVVDARGIVRLRLEEPSAEDYARVELTVARLLAE